MQTRLDQNTRIAAIVLLLAGCAYVLRPFIPAALFAAVFCLATWPAFTALRRWVGGSSVWAAAIITFLVILLVVLPFALLAGALADNFAEWVETGKRWLEGGRPEPPAWLTGLPVVGVWLDEYWHRLAGSREELAALGRRLLEPARAVLVGGGRVVGEGILQMSLATFIAFFLYRDGDAIVGAIRSGMRRVAGAFSGQVIDTVETTVRGVIYGIIGTGLAQGLVAILGFWIAGVPAPLLLGALVALFSLVPVGPPIVWIGATIWLVLEDRIGWAVFMAAWGFFVISGVDNIVKPYLISRGSSLPFVLVLLGVLGGVFAFGFVGIFLGPTLLAVGFGLLRHWVGANGAVVPGGGGDAGRIGR